MQKNRNVIFKLFRDANLKLYNSRIKTPAYLDLEEYELKLQFFKAICINLLAILFISNYKLLAVVILFVLFSFIAEFYRVIVIYQKLKIHPFSKSLYLLVLVSIPFFYFAMSHTVEFQIFHFFLVPVLLYLFYTILFFNQIRSVYIDVINND